MDPRSLFDATTVSALEKLIVGENVESEDLLRWFSQGFCFGDDPTCGLTQSHGGPCGVISVVQAEIFREALFFEANTTEALRSPLYLETLPILSPSECDTMFQKATWRILHRASSDGTVYLMDPGRTKVSSFSDCSQLSSRQCRDEATYHRALHDLMPVYSGQSGCFLYVLSLVMTRGVEMVVGDMDDHRTTLIGNFGHCTQELMNLLLVGQATSNVFDGEVPLVDNSEATSDSVMLKGAPHRTTVGYLTQLEAMRYCQVGSFYKIPLLPIWVVGSTSHFSVLFSADKRVNEESEEEALLTRVQRAFKCIDTDECGFIMEDRLAEILAMIGFSQAEDSDWLHSLSTHLQMEGGGGIILWSQFWETVSMLLTGKSLDEVTCPEGIASGSDSSNTEGNAPSSHRPRSDSELARQLQDEWNSGDGDASWGAVIDQDALPTKKVTRHRSDSIADQNAEVFILYHYNGFTGSVHSSSLPGSHSPPKLTRLRLFTRSQESSIGQSIAFSSGNSAFSGSSMTPIEEVLRTRWPGCRVEWLGCEPRLD